jgi:bifunctional DNA-binding transcriptional regulator/antitoxin component of YhaV-PrlF toxin-antitoxin module
MTPNRVVFERKLSNSTGSIRLVIPPEIVRALGLKPGNKVELWVEGDRIVVGKKRDI